MLELTRIQPKVTLHLILLIIGLMISLVNKYTSLILEKSNCFICTQNNQVLFDNPNAKLKCKVPIGLLFHFLVFHWATLKELSYAVAGILSPSMFYFTMDIDYLLTARQL